MPKVVLSFTRCCVPSPCAVLFSCLFVPESDQESVGGTPIKAPAAERLQQLKVPSKPSLVSLKGKANSEGNSGELLASGRLGLFQKLFEGERRHFFVLWGGGCFVDNVCEGWGGWRVTCPGGQGVFDP